MSAVTVRPLYSFRRPSRSQLWGVYIGSECVLITRVYPSWAVQS